MTCGASCAPWPTPVPTAWCARRWPHRSWGLSWEVLDAQLADELQAGMRRSNSSCSGKRVWQDPGFLPMLHRLLHDQGLAAALLLRGSTQGERALTNLLHLGELLQAASLELQGEGALIRYLETAAAPPARPVVTVPNCAWRAMPIWCRW
jgi:ATP-dependent exoDNAse (exonuclease V) beta subunit